MCQGFFRLVAAVTAEVSRLPLAGRSSPSTDRLVLFRLIRLLRRREGAGGRVRYVLFMHTTQRLTRARRLPALKVSDWGFLNISFCSTMASQKL